ncbi:TIGR03915 family putative DNA repair protein [Mucilaginibacter roseus]|uniref:TIGR03915 family putative DNA repair protein n=1 Tax=Mucilaginibacter roseus TaxID=1528868 RepID=A0ABS8U1M5_9SPHI|nr:TIGR03915 family putative DNA repair protein [Mucilaginibacter roseus]MCD8739953.1 TIGR03915 family putative DNA repair protein [Mucilaginibacter roseus]
MTTTLVYDGTFEGLLTAVFEVYEHRLEYVKLVKGECRNTALFDSSMEILTDEPRYSRVLKGLQKKLSASGMQRLYVAHLSGIDDADPAVLGYIRYVFDAPLNIEEDYGNRYVMRVSEIVKMMRREKHRMEAFIRFQKLQDGLFYSVIEPDFNVLPMLIRHFKNRYADQKWMIYDLKRKYGIYYDLHQVEYMEMDFSDGQGAANVVSSFNEDEDAYQHLWKNYFKSVNIASRKNTKLHIRHIPKRYWKHLTEKI